MGVLSCVPLAEYVVYYVGCGRWSEFDGVVKIVCMDVGDKGCEVVIVVYVEDGDRVE